MSSRTNTTSRNRTQTPAAAPQDAPNTDAPDATPALDAPEQTPAAAAPAPSTEGNETVTPSDAPDAAPEAAPADPTAALLATATSATASQDERRGALTALFVAGLREFFAQVRAMPDDRPLLADILTEVLPGWSGRGPAASRASLTVAQAALGAGNYFGQCHDNTGRNPMDVRLVLPVQFAPRFLQIFKAMHAPSGY